MGKETTIHYLGAHNDFYAPDVAALTGAIVANINRVVARMARVGLLAIESRIWRTVHYRLVIREEWEGKMDTDLISKKRRQNVTMKQILAVYGAKR